MAYDRFVAVCRPLHYNIIMSDIVCMDLLASAGVIGCLLAVEQVFLVCQLVYCGPNEVNHFYCDVGQVVILASTCDEHFYIYEVIFIFSALLVLTIPFLLVLASYICIIGAILKIRSAAGRWKAFSSCYSHLTLVIVQYSLLSFIYLRPKSTFHLDQDRFFVLTFILITPIIIPIIYSLRNAAVKSAFEKQVIRVISKKCPAPKG
ncbi:olfactory receptor 10R2-like [Ambystoma mexicanum]|uniref:olfactory receptor 10R2-like n=1 Tax=Ambystoma mexicanum TaxID=8296 RepID=UPI0037E86401